MLNKKVKVSVGPINKGCAICSTALCSKTEVGKVSDRDLILRCS